MNKRRLLIRPGGIGDCILCFPAMQHLRSHYTEAWTTSAVVPLVQFADRVRSIAETGLDLVGVGDLPVTKALAEQLASFDEIVTWYGSARAEFRETLARLNANCKFMAALPPADYRGNAVDFFAEQVGAPNGLRPQLKLARADGRESAIIHPFSGGKRKNWPLEHFRELARDLPMQVEWIAGPEEELLQARRFANLLELAEWIAGARLYIGNDSGMTHLAALTGVPVLALFGPTDPCVWAPRGATVMRSESLSLLHPREVLQQALRLVAPLSASSAGSDCVRL